MENKKVRLLRIKDTDYVINFEKRRYIWSGKKARFKITPTVEISFDYYEYLCLFTTCFKNGELVIDPKQDNYKELLELIENYKEI